jgi:hypothetical protein
VKNFLTALIALLCLTLAGAGSVSAHQPRLVGDEQTVEIKNPEISQAFYATLEGEPDRYRIDSDQEFSLYVGLLVPELPEISTAVTAEVFKVTADGDELLFRLDGERGRWEKHFEPFAGDRYYKGPEKEETVPAGRYRIRVSSPENRGKYVLVVGKEERFTFIETVNMITALPALKRDFFEKSPLTAYFNLVGLFMLLALLLLIASAAGLYWLVKYVRQRYS